MSATDNEARMVSECVQKLHQIVVQSRVKLSARESLTRAPNHWFNLDLPDLPSLRGTVEAEMKRGGGGLNTELNIDILLRAAALPSNVLLERWSVHYERDTMGLRTRRADPRGVYKRMIVLARTVLAYTRLMPAHETYRASHASFQLGDQGSQHEDGAFGLFYTVSAAEPSAAVPMFDGDIRNFVFSPPVQTSVGSLHVSVFYRAECNFGFAQVKPRSVNEHVIARYFGEDGGGARDGDSKAADEEPSPLPSRPPRAPADAGQHRRRSNSLAAGGRRPVTVSVQAGASAGVYMDDLSPPAEEVVAAAAAAGAQDDGEAAAAAAPPPPQAATPPLSSSSVPRRARPASPSPIAARFGTPQLSSSPHASSSPISVPGRRRRRSSSLSGGDPPSLPGSPSAGPSPASRGGGFLPSSYSSRSLAGGGAASSRAYATTSSTSPGIRTMQPGLTGSTPNSEFSPDFLPRSSSPNIHLKIVSPFKDLPSPLMGAAGAGAAGAGSSSASGVGAGSCFSPTASAMMLPPPALGSSPLQGASPVLGRSSPSQSPAPAPALGLDLSPELSGLLGDSGDFGGAGAAAADAEAVLGTFIKHVSSAPPLALFGGEQPRQVTDTELAEELAGLRAFRDELTAEFGEASGRNPSSSACSPRSGHESRG